MSRRNFRIDSRKRRPDDSVTALIPGQNSNLGHRNEPFSVTHPNGRRGLELLHCGTRFRTAPTACRYPRQCDVRACLLGRGWEGLSTLANTDLRFAWPT